MDDEVPATFNCSGLQADPMCPPEVPKCLVDLGKAGLISFPEGLGKLECAGDIRILYIHGNRIPEVTASSFDGLERLLALGIHGNMITELKPGTFDSLTQLQELWLYQNKITELEVPLDSPSPLCGAKLRGMVHAPRCMLQPTVFDKLTQLKALGIHELRISSLPPGIFDALTQLLILTMFQNRIAVLPPGIFDKLVALTHPDFSSNRIPTLPERILEHQVGRDTEAYSEYAKSPIQLDRESLCSLWCCLLTRAARG